MELIHFLTLAWNDERPRLQYRRDPRDEATEMLELAVGAPLTIMLHAPRQCIGFYDFVARQKVPCPDQRRTGPKYAQCFACQRREVTYYTFTGYAADPEAAQAYLQTQPHQAYLALFGADLVKVGVASEGRRLRRTLEQGALACMFFAGANGSDIRVLERAISRTLRYKEQVRTLQKVKRLAVHVDEAAARQILGLAAHRVAAELWSEAEPYWLAEPGFFYHQPKYHLQLPGGFATAGLVRAVEAGDTYSGVVRGVVGSLLVLEADTVGLLVLPMQRLQGYMLTVAATHDRPRLHHQLQTVAIVP